MAQWGTFGKEPPSKLGGIQDLEIQFELFGIMLMLDISTNHLSRYKVRKTLGLTWSGITVAYKDVRDTGNGRNDRRDGW